MFRQIRVKLSGEPHIRPQQNWAYDIYSALMEKLAPEAADQLHNDGIKPVSHYLLPRSSDKPAEITWIINLLGKETVDKLFPVIASLEAIHLRHYETELKVQEIIAGPLVREKDFVASHLLRDDCSSINQLSILSPSSFKSNGEYQIFPTAELIIKSAVQKWNAFAGETVVDDQEALEHLIDHSRIISYALKSSNYRVKGVRIPGFTGHVNLEVRGPLPLVRLYNLLINFLAYSGVGIKSSLGMGGCSIEPSGRAKQAGSSSPAAADL